MNWIDLIRYSADSALRSVMGMRPRFWLRRAARSRDLNPAKSKSASSSSAYQRTREKPELVHDRPAHLEDRYGVLEDKKQLDVIFANFREKLFEDAEALSAAARRGQGGKTIFREAGKTSDGRAYIFFKPLSDYGWLIERSGAGWRISRAEKIISQQMFLRSNSDPWDVAVLFSDPKHSGTIRVNSQRFGQTLMSMAVYEQRMRESFEVELLGSLI